MAKCELLVGSQSASKQCFSLSEAMVRVLNFLVCITLGLAGSLAVAEPPSQFVGCITQIPKGGLELGSPSGNSYRLRGDSQLLLRHINQLAKVHGRLNRASEGEALPVLDVEAIDRISDSCASPLPTGKPQTAVGKVGEGEVAVPLTTTASVDETTPGFQTETIEDEGPPNSGRSSPPGNSPAERPYGPGNPAQAAQSTAAAELYADAATRSEIQPGNTLGAATALASPGRETQSPEHAILVQLRGDGQQEFVPARVTIKAGETVTWKNASSDAREVAANPAAAKPGTQSALPPNTKPFDSGLLQPGETFSYTFNTPGVYRYFCSANCSASPAGEVIVQR